MFFGQHFESCTSVSQLGLLVQPVSVCIPNERKRDVSYRCSWRNVISGESIFELISIFLRFLEDFSNFCFTILESIFNDGTSQKVDVVNCYLRFVLYDGGNCGCWGQKWSMKMYASGNAHQYSLWAVVEFISSAPNDCSQRSTIARIQIRRFSRFYFVVHSSNWRIACSNI